MELARTKTIRMRMMIRMWVMVLMMADGRPRCMRRRRFIIITSIIIQGNIILATATVRDGDGDHILDDYSSNDDDDAAADEDVGLGW